MNASEKLSLLLSRSRPAKGKTRYRTFPSDTSVKEDIRIAFNWMVHIRAGEGGTFESAIRKNSMEGHETRPPGKDFQWGLGTNSACSVASHWEIFQGPD